MPAFVLMGSGEFMPWAKEPDAWAIGSAGVDSDRVLVAPAASAPEGEDTFARWASQGIDHYTELGLKPELLPVRTREDADDAEIAAAISGARYLFLSGGNPGYLAATLAGTRTWRAIVDAVANGMALGGCSAGLVALGVKAGDTAKFGTGQDPWVEGLRLFSKAYFGPHWDALDSFIPGLQKRLAEAKPDGSILFAIDEDTAACGDGLHWRVYGNGVLTLPGPQRLTSGSETIVDLGLDLG